MLFLYTIAEFLFWWMHNHFIQPFIKYQLSNYSIWILILIDFLLRKQIQILTYNPQRHRNIIHTIKQLYKQMPYSLYNLLDIIVQLRLHPRVLQSQLFKPMRLIIHINMRLRGFQVPLNCWRLIPVDVLTAKEIINRLLRLVLPITGWLDAFVGPFQGVLKVGDEIRILASHVTWFAGMGHVLLRSHWLFFSLSLVFGVLVAPVSLLFLFQTVFDLQWGKWDSFLFL